MYHLRSSACRPGIPAASDAALRTAADPAGSSANKPQDLSGGDRFDHFRRVGERKNWIEILAQAARIDAPASRIIGIAEDGGADLDLGIPKPAGRPPMRSGAP